MYEALPTAGLPYFVQSWSEFTTLCETLRKAKAITSLKDLWWDVRPSPGFGTLEIRVCDSPATLAETVAIVAFIHGLAHWFKDHGDWLSQVPQPQHWLMRENKWRVIRHGMDADLVMNAEGDNQAIREDILGWIEKIEPYAMKLGYVRPHGCAAWDLRQGQQFGPPAISIRQEPILARGYRFNMQEFKARRPLWE